MLGRRLSGAECLLPHELSGGMKKRVGLARAIAYRPEIMLYDEPSTGIDPIRADAINDLIIKLKNDLASRPWSSPTTWSAPTRSPTVSPCSITVDHRGRNPGRNPGFDQRVYPAVHPRAGRGADQGLVTGEVIHETRNQNRHLFGGDVHHPGRIHLCRRDLSTWFRKPGYELSVLFSSATGWRNTQRRAWPESRSATSRTSPGRAQSPVVMAICRNTSAERISGHAGLSGDRRRTVHRHQPSDRPDFMQPGETMEARPTIGFDQIGSLAASIGDELKAVSQSIREMTDEETRQNLAGILTNLNSFTLDLGQFLAANRDELETGIGSISRAAQGLDQRLGDIPGTSTKPSRRSRALPPENQDSINSNSGSSRRARRAPRVRPAAQNSLEKIDKARGRWESSSRIRSSTMMPGDARPGQ